MRYFRAFIMSIGMFSAIPVPKNSWNDKYTALCAPCLPIVGALFGLLWYGAALGLSCLSVPVMLQAAAVTLIPIALSGALHLDGYMDVSDAVLSRRGLEERRRILKDPHIGAFAAIMLAGLLLLQFAAAHALVSGKGNFAALLFIPVISRCAAALALLRLKPMSDTGFAAVFRAGTGAAHTVFVLIAAIIAVAAAFMLFGTAALIPLCVEIIAALCVSGYVYRQLEGISGDACGCIITVCELAGLLALGLGG